MTNQEPSRDACPDPEMIELLRTARTIAVVGLSPKEDRPAYRVSAYMQAQGYRIIPVNPLAAPVLGEVGYPSLEAIPADIRIDIVNLFRRAEDTPPLAEASVRLQARALWLQSGIINETSMEIARSAGLLAVQDRCLMVEHRRLASQL